MALTTEDIVTAVNTAGFETVADLAAFLNVAGLRIQRGKIDAQIAQIRATTQQSNEQAEAQIQLLTEEARTIDAAIGQAFTA